MSGYSVEAGRLRAASAELDARVAHAAELVCRMDALAVPAGSFGRLGESVAATYARLHERKVAALDSVVRRLRAAGGMATNVADMYLVRDRATADALNRQGART